MLETLEFVPQVPVFDGHLCVGRPHDQPVAVATREQLLAAMDGWRVGYALVYHTSALHYDGNSGNAELMEWIGGERRLTPQWCANFALEHLDGFARRAEEAGVRALRTAPRSGGYPFVPWVVDEWLAWIRDTGRALWISLNELDPHDFYLAVHRHPDLKVVLSDGHYTHHARIWPLMRALPNVLMELSRYDVAGGARKLADAFGAHRFVFGSTYPDLAPEPYLFYLHHAGLDEAELRAVCAGNLERLLS